MQAQAVTADAVLKILRPLKEAQVLKADKATMKQAAKLCQKAIKAAQAFLAVGDELDTLLGITKPNSAFDDEPKFDTAKEREVYGLARQLPYAAHSAVRAAAQAEKGFLKIAEEPDLSDDHRLILKAFDGWTAGKPGKDGSLTLSKQYDGKRISDWGTDVPQIDKSALAKFKGEFDKVAADFKAAGLGIEVSAGANPVDTRGSHNHGPFDYPYASITKGKVTVAMAQTDDEPKAWMYSAFYTVTVPAGWKFDAEKITAARKALGAAVTGFEQAIHGPSRSRGY